MRATIISLYFYMKIAIFLFKIISKYIPKRMNHKFFKKFLLENNYYPIAILYLKYLFFYIKNCKFKKNYIKNDNFSNFLNTKSDQNILQIKRTKLHHFKKFSRGGGHAPEPPSKAHGFTMRSMSLRDMQISKSEKKLLPPPCQILGTPLMIA